MMQRRTDRPRTLPIVSSDEERTPASVLRALASIGLDPRPIPESSSEEDLRAALEETGPPPAVLLAPDVTRPVGLARLVHRLVPSAHLLILVPDAEAPRLRDELGSAPLIGPHWQLIDPESPDLVRVVEVAVRSGRQRASLRTTLDRMNLKIRERVATDSDTYRRLVVSDRHLASILEYAGDAILSIDSSYAVASWNLGAARMFGLAAQEAVGRPVDLLVGRDHADDLRSLVRHAWAGRPARNELMACRRADGSSFYAELTLAPVRHDSGDAVAVSIIARDVTKRLAQESQIRALNEELERRVDDLASANHALKRALEMLEAKKRELIALNEELEHRATTDALTGLKNRIVFQNSLDEMIAVAARQGAPLSVLVLDVDHFKRVNDRWGHLEGDRVLKAIAKALTAHTRAQDIVARFGGEEFAVLLPSTTADAAMAVAENLRVGCHNAIPSGLPGLELTVSVGVATFEPSDTEASLVGRADEALYASKAKGRNRVTHSDSLGPADRSADGPTA